MNWNSKLTFLAAAATAACEAMQGMPDGVEDAAHFETSKTVG